MITDRFIKGYAVIKSQWTSASILDEYIPFLATIIASEKMTVIDENLLCQKMLEKYDVHIQPSFVRMVLSHSMVKGLISKVREQYVVNKGVLGKFVIKDSDFDSDWDAMLNAFLDYCNQSSEAAVEPKDIIQKNIISFIEHYDDHVLYNSIADIDVKDNQFLYSWCNFIQNAKTTNQSVYSFVLGLCSANLLKNTLFYSSNSSRNQSDVTLFLDTPMIFALLGMDTIERKRSYEYIVNKAQKAGMGIRVFDHNLEESRGIIGRASRWARSGLYDSAKANKVAEYLHDNYFEETEISELIDGLEATLNALGIIVDHSAYLAEENDFQLDERKLTDAIKTEYGKRSLKYNTEEIYENSISVDVRSIVMIQRKRAGAYSTNLKNCRYLFVTTNGAIAKVSKDVAAEDEISRDMIPNCVTTDILGTLLWMDFPDDSENYLSLKLIADCKSLLKPSQEMIARFNLQLDKAYERQELTEERFLFLRSHPIVRDKLLDVTSGDYSTFTDSTWREVYSRIEAHAQFEGDKKYEAEKEEHGRTKQMLAEATESLSEKNNALIEKENIINEQLERYSFNLARIISVLVLGIPYLALSLIALFLQNEYFNWTYRGIVIGIFTVILILLIGFGYKKIETMIAQKIRDNMKGGKKSGN